MNKEIFSKLNRGDIIKHISNTKTLVVAANYGNRVTAITTVDMTNPDEWVLVLKATYDKLPEVPPPPPKRLIREDVKIIKECWIPNDEDI